jgi:hypothetical protein
MPKVARPTEHLPIAEDEEAANRQTASLAAVAFTLALLVAGLFLVNKLHQTGMMEDCLMAGRMTCDLIVATRG